MPGGPITRTVLLRHTLPDGSWHHDWLIERPGGAGGADERRLIAFRVRPRIDREGVEAFPAERIADHRAVYLEYEGPISGGRGAVERVAAGEASLLGETPRSVRVRVRFPGGLSGELEGVAREEGWWFRIVAGPRDSAWCGDGSGVP